MPFALTNDPSQSEISEAINYLLANFGPNVSADPNTGQITGPSGIVIAYLYQYLAVKYADSIDGSLNFSNSPTNRFYFGVNNSNFASESTNPADYIWYKVEGGFGTTKFLWYITTGGRQIQFAVDTVAPDTGWVQDSGAAIDLDIITSATTPVVIESFTSYFSPPILQVPRSGDPLTPSFTGIEPALYATDKGVIVPFVDSQTDSDSAFVNSTWRIGNSSTTGYGDISLTNITIGDPSDGGDFALWPTPTAMSSSPAYITVPIRYKNSLGVVSQASVGTQQLLFADPGATGPSGDQFVTVFLYQWSTTVPGDPSGTSTYTWATGANSGYTGGNYWNTSIGTNPGTPLIKLWTASTNIYAVGGTTTTTVNWSSGFTVAAFSQNGDNGASGVQTARPTVYQWAPTIPSGPTGTSTYTWATGAFAAPSGWSTSITTSPSAGYTLWAASVSLVDSATAITSTINWSTATILAAGYAGQTGPTGASGLSSRLCFARVASNPTPVSGSITTSGSSSFPTSGQSSSTWGFAATWSGSDPDPSSTNSLYQSDGIYNPSTGNTTWSTPYISSLKVGTLSAITVNTGALTVQDSLTVSTTGNIKGGQTAYNTGTGFFLGYSSSTYKFSIGSSTINMLWDGSAFTINGGTIAGGSIRIGTGSAPGGSAFYVSTAGAVYVDNIFGGIGRYTNDNYTGVALQAYTSKAYEALIGTVNATNSSSLAHGIRGQNTYNGTSGLVGVANGYDFYADGSGTNYGPFTGNHDLLLPIDQTLTPGDLVVDVTCIARNGWSNAIFEVTRSTLPNQAGARGIFIGELRPLSSVQPPVFIDYWEQVDGQSIPVMTAQYEAIKNDYWFGSMSSLGEGQMNVCGENGDIAVDTLIVSSSTAGVGMAQSDDVIRGKTVAKAREAVTFASPTEIKQVACIYVSG
jgi:hypothetical protein